jgi:hypothetical protein
MEQRTTVFLQHATVEFYDRSPAPSACMVALDFIAIVGP